MIWIITLVALELLVCFIYGFRAAGRRYWNVLIAADILLNTYFGGSARETISTRAARQSHKRGWRLMGRILDKIDPNHMARSLEEQKPKPAWD